MIYIYKQVLVGVSHDQFAGLRENVIGWLEMTISFVTWSVNHVTSLGSSDHFRPSCSVNHVINFVTWSVKPRDQLRDWSEGHAIG